MKAIQAREIHFTPWHLRERTRNLRRELAKTVQSNFFYSFLFLPRPKRDAIIDVYAFCRAIDDIVDDIVEKSGAAGAPNAYAEARVELNRWREELDNLYAGKPTMPIAVKLRRVLERFPMPKEYFEEMINGCEMDLLRNRYETFDELHQYCYRVASITGLMCIEIFTYRSPGAKDYAVNLGIALQLTNILRDLKEDAARGRVYLPQEDLRLFGYSEDELAGGKINDNFRELMKFECERARGYYRLAAGHLADDDRPTMTAAITMGKIYYRLLEQIENLDYDVFNNRIRLHRPERFLIAFSEWAKATGRQREWETGGQGDRGTGGQGDGETRR
ncbi:MAG TPA: presqualene diphosphate synthase HpnD [Blastocatellia bacterium]|nr:presqualene diphosphate synthase HpnD [Blastocatellia bacterium]